MGPVGFGLLHVSPSNSLQHGWRRNLRLCLAPAQAIALVRVALGFRFHSILMPEREGKQVGAHVVTFGFLHLPHGPVGITLWDVLVHDALEPAQRHQRLVRAGGVADAEGEQGLCVLRGVRDPRRVASFRSSERFSCSRSPSGRCPCPSWPSAPVTAHDEVRARSSGVHRDVELAQLGHQLAFVELPWRHLAHDSGEEDKACEQLD